MYTADEYNNLVSKYGSCASWAIWNTNNDADLSVIDNSINQLNSRHVLLGLNISHFLVSTPWTNFHGGSIHDRKLKYACNNSELRGSYMTDIFKGIEEPVAKKLIRNLTHEIIDKNVAFFQQEMRDIKINDDSVFVVFGTDAGNCFKDYFSQYYKNKVVYYYHYSYYGINDKEWVTRLWKKLNINRDFQE